jgi:hypothetical protein
MCSLASAGLQAHSGVLVVVSFVYYQEWCASNSDALMRCRPDSEVRCGENDLSLVHTCWVRVGVTQSTLHEENISFQAIIHLFSYNYLQCKMPAKLINYWLFG